MGRLDEGLAQSREAARLDPLSVGPVHDIAINYMVRGDFEQAAANFRRAIEIDPNWTWGYIKLARTLAHQKKCPEALAQAAIAEARIAGGAAPLSRSWLGVTYAICGETRARPHRSSTSSTPWRRSSTWTRSTFAARPRRRSARWTRRCAAYEKAFEDRTPNMVYASMARRINPELAGNPRYEAIVRRMGFPPVTATAAGGPPPPR